MDQHVSNLNWFDITIVSIVCISTLFALFRGFIRAVFSLVTWIASSVVATFLYPFILEYFTTKIHSEKLAMAASFGAGFVIAFIVLAIISSIIINSMDGITGGTIDRFLGFVFGAARGVLIACLIFFSISMTSKMLHLGADQQRPGPQWFSKAATYDILDTATKRMLEYAPEDMPSKLEKTVDKFKDATVSAMGEELESSPASAKTLSDKQRQLMKKVISTLPKEDIAEIYKKMTATPLTFLNLKKLKFFKEMLAKYKAYEKEGKIAAKNAIADSSIQELDDALSAEKKTPDTSTEDSSPKEGELGYKENSIKQLDRLVDGVNKQ